MKNKIFLIIFQIILCLLCFLNNWFKDNIVYGLPAFTFIIFDILLFIAFFTCYFFSFKKIKTFSLFQKLCTIFLCIITFLLSLYDFRLIKTRIELKLYKEQRYVIVEKIKKNEYLYYNNKNIELPIYQYVSSDGEVYVHKNDSDGQVICFWIARGVMSSSVQLIYTSEESLIHDNINSISKIIKLENHWYYVVTK